MIKFNLFQETHASCRTFESQVYRFSNLSELLIAMTEDPEGRRMVQISFKQLDDLKTKLINAIQVRLAVSNVAIKQLDWSGIGRDP